MKLRIVFLTLLLFCSSFANTEVTSRKTAEEDIRDCVFRYQFTHNASGQQKGAKVYFLAINSADPSEAFMSRFQGHQPPVKKRSLAETDGQGVRDKATGAPGLVFNSGKITWPSDHVATVEGGYFEAGLSASGNVYTVEKRKGKWVVTKDVMQWIS